MEQLAGHRSPSPSLGSDWETVAPVQQVQIHHLPDQDSSDSDGDWHINSTSDTESSDSTPPFEAFRRLGDPALLPSPALSQSGSAGARGPDTEDSEDSETEESEVSEEMEGGGLDCGADADDREEGCPCGASKAFGPSCLCFGAVDLAGEENAVDEDQESNSLQCCCCGLAFEDPWLKVEKVLDCMKSLFADAVTKCKEQCNATSLGLREIVLVCVVVVLAQIVVFDRYTTQVQLDSVTSAQEEVTLATQRLWDLLASQDSLNAMKHDRVDGRLDDMQEQLNIVRNLTSTNGETFPTTLRLSVLLSSQDSICVHDSSNRDAQRDAQLEYLQERSAREEVQVVLLHRQVALLTTEVERVKQEGLEAAQQAQQALYQAHLLQADLRRQHKEAKRLREQSRRLRAEGDSLRKHSRKLLRQSKKLRRECKTLRHQGQQMRRELAAGVAAKDRLVRVVDRPVAADVSAGYSNATDFTMRAALPEMLESYACPWSRMKSVPDWWVSLDEAAAPGQLRLPQTGWSQSGLRLPDVLLPSLRGIRRLRAANRTFLSGKDLDVLDNPSDWSKPATTDIASQDRCKLGHLCAVEMPGIGLDDAEGESALDHYGCRLTVQQPAVDVTPLECSAPRWSTPENPFGQLGPADIGPMMGWGYQWNGQLGLADDDDTLAWGWNPPSQLGLADDDDTLAWGWNPPSQLGLADFAPTLAWRRDPSYLSFWNGALVPNALVLANNVSLFFGWAHPGQLWMRTEEQPGEEWWRFHGRSSESENQGRAHGGDALSEVDARSSRGGYRVREDARARGRAQRRAETRTERRQPSKGSKREGHLGRRGKPTKRQQHKSGQDKKQHRKWWKKHGDGHRRRQHGEFRCGHQETESCFWWDRVNSGDWLREGDVWLQSAVDLGRKWGFAF
mmetsp:Transcript_99961/g.229427  ORF Transcript_99961/g.229427 Transcript_99961/m.229427 type:complete len:903 (-) Transcript_99961:400-3108(-)